MFERQNGWSKKEKVNSTLSLPLNAVINCRQNEWIRYLRTQMKMIDWGRDIIQSHHITFFPSLDATQLKPGVGRTQFLFWFEEQERGLLMLRVNRRNITPFLFSISSHSQPSVQKNRMNKASAFWPRGVKRGHLGNIKVSERVWRGRSWEKWPHKAIYELVDKSPDCACMGRVLNCLP